MQVFTCKKVSVFHPDHMPDGNGEPGNGVYESCAHVIWADLPLVVDDLREETSRDD